jgi:hypothetical protein
MVPGEVRIFSRISGARRNRPSLCHPGTGDSLLAGDIRLSGDRTGLQESLPFDGFPEEFDDSGGLG